jgi:hypothetical protein
MRNVYVLAVISAFSMFSNGYTGENMNRYSYGYQKFGKETVDNIQANGSVIIEGTTVLNLVFVNGSLNADESIIDSLQVNGQVDIKDSVVNNTSRINGSLNADNTEFHKELSVASQKLILKNCSVDSLIVREVNGYDGIQIVELRGATKIIGPIIVESGNGEIWISSKSEILDQEHIRGAKVIRK